MTLRTYYTVVHSSLQHAAHAWPHAYPKEESLTGPARASVHSIDHFALNVRDLAETLRFVTAFGLVGREVAGGIALTTAHDDHISARLIGASAKSLG